jgi:hypothetical protein
MFLYNVHAPNKTFAVQYQDGQTFKSLLDRIASKSGLSTAEQTALKGRKEGAGIIYEFEGERWSLEDGRSFLLRSYPSPPPLPSRNAPAHAQMTTWRSCIPVSHPTRLPARHSTSTPLRYMPTLPRLPPLHLPPTRPLPRRSNRKPSTPRRKQPPKTNLHPACRPSRSMVGPVPNPRAAKYPRRIQTSQTTRHWREKRLMGPRSQRRAAL